MAKETVAPKLTELKVSYSVGVKANLGNYENADAHVSRGETWDVTGMTEEEVTKFYNDRIAALHVELGLIIEAEYADMFGGSDDKESD